MSRPQLEWLHHLRTFGINRTQLSDFLRTRSALLKGRRPLRKNLGPFAFAVIVAAPNSVQAASGAAALQYYVGTWSCQAGAIGKPASKSTVIYSFDSGLLREWVDVPPQGKMATPYLNSIATSYDAKKGRYVQTGTDNEGFW